MGKGKDRSILIDIGSLRNSIEDSLARSPSQTYTQLAWLEISDICSRVRGVLEPVEQGSICRKPVRGVLCCRSVTVVFQPEISSEAIEPLFFVVQPYLLYILILDCTLCLERCNDIVLLTQGLRTEDIISIWETQVIQRLLAFMIILLIETMRKLEITLKLPVQQTVGQITIGKPSVIQIGRCHSSQSYTPSLNVVPAQEAEDRAYIKFRHLFRFSRRNPFRDKSINRLGPERDICILLEILSHFFYGQLSVCQSGDTVFLPIFRIKSLRVRKHFCRTVNPIRRIICKEFLTSNKIVETSCLMSKDTLRAFKNGKIHIWILSGQSPKTILCLVESLVDAQFIDPVDIAAGRKVQLNFLYGIVAVCRDIYPSCKSETLTVERHKSKVYTSNIVYLDGIHNIILIVRCSQGRWKRRYKSVRNECNFIVKDIHTCKQLVQSRGKTSVAVQLLIKTSMTHSLLNRLFRMRRLPVIIITELLPYGKG